MKHFIIAAIVAGFFQSPAAAQNTPVLIAEWLERCYVAADTALAAIPSPKTREFRDARRKASQIESDCWTGPSLICRYSANPSDCLAQARVWVEQERDRIVAKLPRTLPKAQSNASRSMQLAYFAFIESDGQPVEGIFSIEICIGQAASIPGRETSPEACALQQAVSQLSRARDYDRRIVAGVLR